MTRWQPASMRSVVTTFVAVATLTPMREAHALSPNDAFNPSPNNIVSCVAEQSDGKIVVGGLFSTIGGQSRSHLARLQPDGSADSGFVPDPNLSVEAVAIQSDGKILVGGSFTSIGGGARASLARLHADGTLDASFSPVFNNAVGAIAIQPDGKILVGGAFTSINGMARTHLARLNADGSLDTGFDPGPDNVVFAICVEEDGNVLVGGAFTTIAGQLRDNLARIQADGTLATGFTPNPNAFVRSLALQRDGRILVGGHFTSIGGQPRNYVARLRPNGDLDPAFNPDANGDVNSIACQADGRIVLGGNFTSLNATTRNRIARLNLDGTLDTAFNPNANNFLNVVVVQADGKILVGGAFTSVGGQPRSYLARLELNGLAETTLNPDINGVVRAIALQPDGKMLIGGSFTTIGATTRNRIARLTTSGTLETFNPNANNTVNAIAVQPDGKMLIGGNFTVIGTTAIRDLARLNNDGTLDTSFFPQPNGQVYGVVVEPNGKILVAGNFTQICGSTRNRVARLNTDGTLDTSFGDPGVNGAVHSLARQSDGKLLVGGAFTSVAGVTRNRIARLQPDGSLDADVDPNADDLVLALAAQPDDKILVGGYFSTVAGQGRNRCARLNADGTLDATFNPNLDGALFSIALQADNKILIGGLFQVVGGLIWGTPRNRIARLNPDGTLDVAFDPNANNSVFALAVQGDGKVLVGGDFTNIGGQTRNRLARLSADLPAQSSLQVSSDGTTITWTRGQSAPELADVVFRHSEDMASWTDLGPGSRTAGGWRLSGLSLPFNQLGYILARGTTIGGCWNGSASLVEVDAQYYNALSTTHLLAVARSGTGSGAVTSSPAGIACGAACSAQFIENSDVELSAAAASGSTFAGWNGDCASCGGSTTCDVHMDTDKSCTATFTLNQYQVTADATGAGSGTVSSDPAGIAYTYPATSTGSAAFDHGTDLVLTAQAGANSAASWTACPGTTGGTPAAATCTIANLSAAVTATAAFTLDQHAITENATPPAGGAVSCDPNPVDHGATSTCSITTNAGYTLQDVTGTCGGTLVGSTFTTNAITAPCTVQATFTLVTSVTIPAATGNGDLTVQVGSPGCGLFDVAAMTEVNVALDPDFDYPYGLVSFSLNCQQADVTIICPGSIAATRYRKYGPTTPGSPATSQWYTFTGAEIVGNQAVLHLRDGVLGDDTAIDGVIVDQGGPGQEVQQEGVPIPAMTLWGVGVLTVMIALASAYCLGRST